MNKNKYYLRNIEIDEEEYNRLKSVENLSFSSHQLLMTDESNTITLRAERNAVNCINQYYFLNIKLSAGDDVVIDALKIINKYLYEYNKALKIEYGEYFNQAIKAHRLDYFEGLSIDDAQKYVNCIDVAQFVAYSTKFAKDFLKNNQ